METYKLVNGERGKEKRKSRCIIDGEKKEKLGDEFYRFWRDIYGFKECKITEVRSTGVGTGHFLVFFMSY